MSEFPVLNWITGTNDLTSNIQIYQFPVSPMLQTLEDSVLLWPTWWERLCFIPSSSADLLLFTLCLSFPVETLLKLLNVKGSKLIEVEWMSADASRGFNGPGVTDKYNRLLHMWGCFIKHVQAFRKGSWCHVCLLYKKIKWWSVISA